MGSTTTKGGGVMSGRVLESGKSYTTDNGHEAIVEYVNETIAYGTVKLTDVTDHVIWFRNGFEYGDGHYYNIRKALAQCTPPALTTWPG
jgi:hypothetical protein